MLAPCRVVLEVNKREVFDWRLVRVVILYILECVNTALFDRHLVFPQHAEA